MSRHFETALRSRTGFPDFPGDKSFKEDFTVIKCSDCKAAAQFPFDRRRANPLTELNEWIKNHECANLDAASAPSSTNGNVKNVQ